jgi:predicted nucleic acid-binding protein
MQLILDNSVTMRWLFNDGSPSDQTYAKYVLTSIANSIVIVPGVWCLEVANVIAKAESKYGLTEARSSEFIQALQQMNIQVDPETARYALSDTLQIARRYNLSSYDAAYLELALRKGLPVATLDEGLQKALKKAGAKRFTSKL